MFAWSKEETSFLFEQVQNYGSNWDLIAQSFDKRTPEVFFKFLSFFIFSNAKNDTMKSLRWYLFTETSRVKMMQVIRTILFFNTF